LLFWWGIKILSLSKVSLNRRAYRIGVYIFGMSGLGLCIASCIGVYFVYHDYLVAWNLSSCSLVDSFEYTLNPHANLRTYPWQGFIMDSIQMDIANNSLFSAYQNLTDFDTYDLQNIANSPKALANLVETIYQVHKNELTKLVNLLILYMMLKLLPQKQSII